MPDIQRIDFHGDAITTLKHDETSKVYCVPKEIVEHLGITWGPQARKLAQSEFYQRHTRYHHMVTPGGPQEMLLLDIAYLSHWLGGISAEKVKHAIKAKVLAYQEECAEALNAYWTKGVAVNPRTHGDLLVEMALGIRDQERRIALLEDERKALQEEQLRQQDLLLAQQAQIIETLRTAQQAQVTAHRVEENQAYFTVAEYVYIAKLQSQLPEPAYKACSDHLRIYCLDHNIPFRKQAVGGKRWNDEYAFHENVYVDVLPDWLKRRYAQASLHVIYTSEEA